MSTSRARIDWLDVAKGAAIILVVANHALLVADAIADPGRIIPAIGNILAKIRMPLFFFSSGVLTSMALNRKWMEFAQRRILPVVWVLLVWTVLGQLFDLYIASLYPQGGGALVPGVTEVLSRPQGNLWFVQVLAIMLSMTLVLRNFHRAAALFVIVLLLVLPSVMELTSWVRLVRFTPYFLLGAFFPGTVMSLVGGQIALPRLLLIAGGIFAIAGIIIEWRGIDIPLVTFAHSLSGVVTGCAAAAFVSQYPPVRRLLAGFGRRSLSIFVGHQFFLAILYHVFKDRLPHTPVAVMILAMTGISVAGALAIRRIFDEIGLGWLYVPPVGQVSALVSRARATTRRPV